jgi:hypothetical protein
MPPAECDRAKEDRNRRRKQFGPDVDAIAITREHRLYRCIIEKHVDHETKKPKPAAFDQAGMSVFVEGPGFKALNWAELLAKKKEWIAICAIDAAELLDNAALYAFELLHDPYGDEAGNQHDNHALVVCKKNSTKGTRMQQASVWQVSPPERDHPPQV